jgi:phytoene dehydrogenase-like protein
MKNPKIAIIGAGASGLFAALEAQSLGYDVTLYESHSLPGGCASWFRRSSKIGSLQFDVGATVLDGLSPASLIHRRLESWGVKPAPFHKMKAMHYQLSGNDTSILTLRTHSPELWIDDLVKIFPEDSEFLNSTFRKMGRLAQKLKTFVEGVPHYPLQSFYDLQNNLRLLPQVPSLARALWQTGSLCFDRILEENKISNRLREWIDMNLLITTQMTAQNLYTPWASLALFFYSLGAGTTEGGMRGLMEALLRRLMELPHSHVKMRTRVHSIFRKDKVFFVNAQKTGQGEIFEDGPYQTIVSSIPRFNTQALFPNERIFERRWDWERHRDDLWGAVTAYVALKDVQGLPAEPFNFHSKLCSGEGAEGNDVYMSFSARDDLARCPRGYRVATLSTHTRLKHWSLPQERYAQQKLSFQKVFERHLQRLSSFNQAKPLEIEHIEIGTPRTFEHYTGRLEGNVGGLPMSQSNTLQSPPSQRTLIPGLYQIGDTSFPGQSVYACALGALSCVEKLKREC